MKKILRRGLRIAYSLTGHAVLFLLIAKYISCAAATPPQMLLQNMVKVNIGAVMPQPAAQTPKPPSPKTSAPKPQKPAEQPAPSARPLPAKSSVPDTKNIDSFIDKLSQKLEQIDSSKPQPSQNTASSQNQQQDTAQQSVNAIKTGQNFSSSIWYLDLVCTKISNSWIEPGMIVVKGSPVACVVYFKIMKNGAVVDIKIKSASKFTAFDNSAMSAVAAASPMPPLPPEFTGDFIDINLEFKLER